MRGKNTLFPAAIILLVLGSPVFAYQQVIDLGALGGYQYSKATSINDNGQIVGYAYNSVDLPSNRRACFFDSSGGGANTNLGTLGGSQSCAYSINNNGNIVGNAIDSLGWTYYACSFDSTGGGNNKNLGYNIASCINNKGYVVGQSGSHAIVSTKPEQTWPMGYDLGTLGGSASYAYSINNSYQVVGWADCVSNYPNPSHYHACLFDVPHGTNNIDLGTFGGDYSIAYSINDSGLIVGQADYSTVYTPILQSYYHACIFDASGGGANIDLGTLGGLKSAALFVNNENQVVGYASDSSGQRKACLFDSTGQGNNINLNDLIDPSSGWILESANCINNNGWIVGYGTYNGLDQAFLLTPEPTSAILLVIGATLLRRKK
ncbi:MAG: DUF3466 family protein [Sedimentisphaerales bacterium]|jgi:uncharacterized membrane protein